MLTIMAKIAMLCCSRIFVYISVKLQGAKNMPFTNYYYLRKKKQQTNALKNNLLAMKSIMKYISIKRTHNLYA